MRALNRLSAAHVKHAKVGKHCDGGGLWFFQRPDGGAQWVLRFTHQGRRFEMGLGALRDIPLAAARRQAEMWRVVVKEGRNPMEERQRRLADAARGRPSFAEVFVQAFEARKAELKGDGKAGRWDSPLRVHVVPKIGEREIESLDQADVKAVLDPIWHEKPEAARKALNRMRIVFRHAAAKGLDVDLQATDKAKELLGAQRHTPQHIPALEWSEVPTFFQSLDSNVMSERALQFLILTAARSSEIRYCHLDEIKDDLWTIPAARTKTGVEHRVPLSPAAQTVVRNSAAFARDGFLFPGKSRGVISDMAMTALFRRRDLKARPHGFRSSFRTWCAEATDAPREVAETCLAHKTAGAVEAAYRRTDYIDARRDLMASWAAHVTGVTP